MDIKATIKKIGQKQDLNFKEAESVFGLIFDGKASAGQIAAFLTALANKGETKEEIAALALVIRDRAIKLELSKAKQAKAIIDTCGTGGSGISKFNVSTIVAFILAAYGITVAKHGNRSMSSACGSADILEALGVPIDVDISLTRECLNKVNIGFLYAPLFHPALKQIAIIRKELGIKTIFNLVGPLCNPVKTTHQLLGVANQQLVPVLTEVLRYLGLKKAFVVYGQDLKDEISLTGPTKVGFLNNKTIRYFTLDNSDFGLKKISLKKILVKNIQERCKIVEDIFAGKQSPHLDLVLANASACFYLLGEVKDFKQGVCLAREIIKQGKAKEKFLEFKNFLLTRKK